MLTELRVTNFKGFAGEHSIPLAPVTLLFGSNSSGKTAILHAAALLAENLSASPFRRRSAGFELSAPDLDLGGFRNLIHRHNPDPEGFIAMGATADMVGSRSRHPDILEVMNAYGASHDFKLLQDSDGKVIASDSSLELYGATDLPLDFHRDDDGRMELGHMSLERSAQAADGIKHLVMSLAFATPDIDREDYGSETEYLQEYFAADTVTLPELERLPASTLAKMLQYKTGLRTTAGSIGHFNSLGASRLERANSNIPHELAKLLQQVVLSANLILRQSLIRTDYLGPMRDVPSRLEEIDPNTPDRLTSSGAGIAAMLDRDPRALQLVNAQLQKLGVPYEIEVQSVGQVSLPSAGDYRALVLTDLRTSTQVSPRDLGFGITQLLPVLVALARRSSNLLLVEQPELHLHPRLHADLASTFIDAAVQERPTQVIAETHSENLVLRVQKLVREGVISPEQVSIVYVGAHEGSGSWTQPIRMDEQGRLVDAWPGGFFTERAKEWV